MGDSDDEEVPVQSKKQQKTPQSIKKVQQSPSKQTPGNKQPQSANKQNVSTPLVNVSFIQID